MAAWAARFSPRPIAAWVLWEAFWSPEDRAAFWLPPASLCRRPALPVLDFGCAGSAPFDFAAYPGYRHQATTAGSELEVGTRCRTYAWRRAAVAAAAPSATPITSGQGGAAQEVEAANELLKQLKKRDVAALKLGGKRPRGGSDDLPAPKKKLKPKKKKANKANEDDL